MPDLKGIDAWLAQREATVPALRPGCAKRIIWAGEPEAKTDWAVLYVHGFSATGEELRPLPDLVAGALGANIHFTRLAGHGQDGAAMGEATPAQWRADVDEALEVAAAIGNRVLVIGCSTGCTLLTMAMADGAKVAAVAMISPNFGLRHKVAQALLDLPAVRHYGHLIAGKERAFPAHSDKHAAFWTIKYPTKAVYTMAETVRMARRVAVDGVKAPLLIALNAEDQVVSPSRAMTMMQNWGGPVTHVPLIQTPEDDDMGHVMAGDVFSPGQTAPLAKRIIDWAQSL